MGRDLFASTKSSSKPEGRDLFANTEQEGLGRAALMAIPRIGEDIIKSAYGILQKTPEYFEQAKTEVPGIVNPLNALRNPLERSKVGLRGLLQLGQKINHTPKALAEYAANRLNLIPKSWANMVPEAQDINPALDKYLPVSKGAGNALLQGALRNADIVAPSVKLVGKTTAIKPSNLFRGTLSPDQLKNNLRITQGTETGLGDVIGSPFLKRLNENILSKIPFSGVNEAMQRNAGNIIERGHMLMNSFKGKGNPENLDKYLNDALRTSYESHLAQKNALYKNANQIAKESGLQLELPTFAKEAKKYREAIEDTNILKYEPELQSLLRKVSGYESPVKTNIRNSAILDVFGNPFTEKTTKFPSLEEANLLKGKLNQLARQHGASNNPADRHLAGVFGGLARNLKGDIEAAIKTSKNKSLQDAYKLAEENYGKNFSPFLDKEIYKFINGNADPETIINAFVKTGKSNDRAELINKLVKKLPIEDRNLLGHRYLQSAMDENNVLNPLKLKTLLSRNALGQKQFDALFPNPVLRNALRDYVNLVDMNTKGLKLMQNPDTGQMAMDILPLISKSPLRLGGKMLVAPLVAKKLSSEKTRTKLVKKMIKKSK